MVEKIEIGKGLVLCHLDRHPILGQGGFICFPEEWNSSLEVIKDEKGLKFNLKDKWFGV